MLYKVLWFDDEYKTLETIKEDALINHSIKLVGYSNAKDGLAELLDNPKQYDAILLDGKFFKSNEQSGDDVSDEAFGLVAKTLGNLKAKGIILPWFIFSGQKSFVKDKNVLIKLFADSAFAKGKVFDKNIDEDFIELCQEIKKAVNKQPYTQAKHNNPEIIEIFIQGYLPESVENNVLDLLIQPLPKNNNELKGILTNIRSIQESCFLKLEGISVLDKSLKTFSSKLKHLSGNLTRNNDWKPTSHVYLTKEIKALHEWIYYTCGTYLHYLEKQHNEGYMISNYAVESLRSGLFEILLWFKKTYKENV